MRLIDDSSFLSYDTPILTKRGWRKAQYITPGTIIYDSRGVWTKVLHVEKSSRNRLTYRVTFKDGSYIDGTSRLEIAHLNHREISVIRKRKVKIKRLNEEAKFIKNIFKVPLNRALDPIVYDLYNQIDFKDYITLYSLKKRYNYIDYEGLQHFSPCILPFEYRDKPMKIHPYIIGVWLVNGYSFRAMVRVRKKRILEKAAKYGYNLEKKKYNLYLIRKVYGCFKKMKLFEQKHIPYVYKYGSYKTRLSVLEGMIDGIGQKSKYQCKTVKLTLVDPVIVKDLREMLFTLNVSIETWEFTPPPNGDIVYRKRMVTKFKIPELEDLLDEKYKINNNIKKWLKITDCKILKMGQQKHIGFVVSSNSNSFLAGHQLIPVKANANNIDKRCK